MKKIPPRIIQNAVGLAIFTSLRSGMWSSGVGGSGILIARKTDGTWSPPSGLTLQTSTASKFGLGLNVYDCVVVINTFTMLEAMGRPQVVLGTDVGLTRGPLVTMGLLENDFRWTDLSDTVFTYIRAKGHSVNAKLEGTILHERVDENERFYGGNYSVPKILAGDINQSLPQVRPLTETLKAAEGRTDFDESLLELISRQGAPSDNVLESPSSASLVTSPFGIPDGEDPDPFGVLALEKAGLEIREAGTGLRPNSNQFDYCPSPTSIMFSRISRQSVDSKSNRGSYMSSRTIATERSQATDTGTQTTAASTPTLSPSYSDDGSHVKDIPEEREPADESKNVKAIPEVDYTKIDISALRNLTAFPDSYDEPPLVTGPIMLSTKDAEYSKEAEAKREADKASAVKEDTLGDIMHDVDTNADADDEDEGSMDDVVSPLDEDDEIDGAVDDDDDDVEDDSDFDDTEEPVVFEVATAQSPAKVSMLAAQRVQVKGAVVTIPRRIPPPLPIRSPQRLSRQSRTDFGDLGSIGSPLRQEFDAGSPVDDATTPRVGEHYVLPEDKDDTTEYFTSETPTSDNATLKVSDEKEQENQLRNSLGVPIRAA
jgi:lipid-binding SYLF domain-containing protein